MILIEITWICFLYLFSYSYLLLTGYDSYRLDFMDKVISSFSHLTNLSKGMLSYELQMLINHFNRSIVCHS